jgi:hypothetical protein
VLKRQPLSFVQASRRGEKRDEHRPGHGAERRKNLCNFILSNSLAKKEEQQRCKSIGEREL